MLAASEQIETDQLGGNFAMVGELALNGAVRSVKGILPVAIRARADGKVGACCLFGDNVPPAAVVSSFAPRHPGSKLARSRRIS